MHYTAFFHNYYGDDARWLDLFSQMTPPPSCIFYNCVSGSYYRMKQSDMFLNENTDSSHYTYDGVSRITPNRGKDIGGKLVLIDAYLKLDKRTDYLLLLHDKRSPYHFKGDAWKDDLFKIVQEKNLQKVFGLFDRKPDIGIIASASAVKNEEDNDEKSGFYIQSPFIKSLKEKYNIHPPHLQYVAGTMFWVRSSLVEAFFSDYPPLEIRSQLEAGNITDKQPTFTHAWERLLCWLVTSRGYKITGI